MSYYISQNIHRTIIKAGLSTLDSEWGGTLGSDVTLNSWGSLSMFYAGLCMNVPDCNPDNGTNQFLAKF